jgi:hypothetical protein
MKRLLLTALSAVLLVPIASAFGGMPEPKDPQINPPLTLAGIEIGMTLKKADKQWGKHGDCQSEQGFEGCTYGKIGRSGNSKRGYAEIDANKGKVFLVVIQAPTEKKGTKAKFKGPLMDMISMEGIGLGSTMKDLQMAYPDVKELPGGIGYELRGPGKTRMDFTGYGSKGKRKVTGILLYKNIPE